MTIDKKLLSDIQDYCTLNNLKVQNFINDLLKKAFIEEKYGKKPLFLEKKTTFVTEKYVKNKNEAANAISKEIGTINASTKENVAKKPSRRKLS